MSLFCFLGVSLLSFLGEGLCRLALDNVKGIMLLSYLDLRKKMDRDRKEN